MKIHSGKFIGFAAVAAGLLNLFFAGVAQAGSFTAASDMQSPRSDFTATALPNGKILVAGGLDVSGFLASAELFDPASDTWTATGALNQTRDGHTATLLPDGKVLVVGGVEANDASGESLVDAELYDPAAGTWRVTGSLHVPRRWHTATLLSDGRVLVAGGYNSMNGFVSVAEVYDPHTGKWSLTGKMMTARRAHTATALADGRVLVAGGLTRLGNLANAEIYDPASGKWVTAGAMSIARKYHTATLLPGGKVLVTGGQGVINNAQNALSIAEIYDPATDTWTKVAPLNTARYGQTATLLQNGDVLVVGGIGAAGILSDAEEFNLASGTWTVAGMLATPRTLHIAVLLPNGQVLVAGGNKDESARNLSTAEIFNP